MSFGKQHFFAVSFSPLILEICCLNCIYATILPKSCLASATHLFNITKNSNAKQKMAGMSRVFGTSERSDEK